MKIENIKSFAKELDKIAFIGGLLKPTFGKVLNTAFGAMSISSASSAAKSAGQGFGKEVPMAMGPSRNFLAPDINAKTIGRNSI